MAKTNSTPSGLLATPYSALSNGAHTEVLAGTSEDAAYSNLATAIGLSEANGGHGGSIIAAHNAGENKLTLTQDVYDGDGNKPIVATVANATIPSSFSGGIDPNLDFRDIKFTGEEYIIIQDELKGIGPGFFMDQAVPDYITDNIETITKKYGSNKT